MGFREEGEVEAPQNSPQPLPACRGLEVLPDSSKKLANIPPRYATCLPPVLLSLPTGLNPEEPKGTKGAGVGWGQQSF